MSQVEATFEDVAADAVEAVVAPEVAAAPAVSPAAAAAPAAPASAAGSCPIASCNVNQMVEKAKAFFTKDNMQKIGQIYVDGAKGAFTTPLGYMLHVSLVVLVLLTIVGVSVGASEATN